MKRSCIVALWLVLILLATSCSDTSDQTASSSARERSDLPQSADEPPREVDDPAAEPGQPDDREAEELDDEPTEATVEAAAEALDDPFRNTTNDQLDDLERCLAARVGNDPARVALVTEIAATGGSGGLGEDSAALAASCLVDSITADSLLFELGSLQPADDKEVGCVEELVPSFDVDHVAAALVDDVKGAALSPEDVELWVDCLSDDTVVFILFTIGLSAPEAEARCFLRMRAQLELASAYDCLSDETAGDSADPVERN